MNIKGMYFSIQVYIARTGHMFGNFTEIILLRSIQSQYSFEYTSLIQFWKVFLKTMFTAISPGNRSLPHSSRYSNGFCGCPTVPRNSKFTRSTLLSCDASFLLNCLIFTAVDCCPCNVRIVAVNSVETGYERVFLVRTSYASITALLLNLPRYFPSPTNNSSRPPPLSENLKPTNSPPSIPFPWFSL